MKKKQQRILVIVLVLSIVGYILYTMYAKKRNLQQLDLNESQQSGSDMDRPVGSSGAFLGTDSLGNPVSVTPDRDFTGLAR